MTDGHDSFLRDAFHTRHDDRMRADLDHDNLIFARDVAICLCAFNIVSLIVLPLITLEHEVLINSGVCAAFCVVAGVVASHALKRDEVSHALA